MTQQNNYPSITYEQVFALYTISQNMKQDPTYLENSPYSETIRKSLQLIFHKVERNNLYASEISSEDLDLKQETQSLYRETKALLHTNVLDEKDKAAIIKTATSQMEKIISLIERSEAISQIREFEAKVLRVLKKVLPEQREEFIQELARMEGENDRDE